MNNQITGPLSALIPFLTTVFLTWGLDSATAGLAAGAVVAVAAVGWSWWSNRPKAQIAAVAAMSGTVVSSNGKQIDVVDPELARAAKAAATDVAGASVRA